MSFTTGSSSLPVPYLDANGNLQYQSAAIPINSGMTTLTSGWYVVNSTVTFAQRLAVSGDVHIILADNCLLVANNGISVTQGNNLSIYAQTTDAATMGSLTAVGGASRGAGIGGVPGANESGSITINGGMISATGEGESAGIGSASSARWGAITINGGIVTATGGTRGSGSDLVNGGAGIGGGDMSGIRTLSFGSVTINGGTVRAQGGFLGAGIGAGASGIGGIITITGGTVDATGGLGGAGIGGGCADGAGFFWNEETLDYEMGAYGGGPGGTITITGGNITATGGNGYGTLKFAGAGIGGGGGQLSISGATSSGYGGDITITGSANVRAQGGARGGSGGGGAGIGSGAVLNASVEPGAAGNITIGSGVTLIALGGNRGFVYAGADIGTGGSHNQPGISAAGNIVSIVEVSATAPDTNILTREDRLFRTVFDPLELIYLADRSKTASVILSVDETSETVSEQEKQLVDNAIKTNPALQPYNVGMYLDIKLYKVFGGSDPVALSSLSNPVKLGIIIPSSLMPNDREFTILRIHGAEVEVLGGVLDRTINQFNFETDKFSTYVLLYKSIPSGGVIPRTGDAGGHMMQVAVLLALAAACIFTARVRRSRMQR